AAEVEEEVTNVIEQAVQTLGQLDYVESRSSRGISSVKAVIKSNYDKHSLPQVWDELRRKVGDAAVLGKLPPGAGPSLVNDDFGDVYGVYVALTGDGYSYKEIYEYAKFMKRELLQVPGVKRIELFGDQPEVVYIEMRRDKMTQFGVSPDDIYAALRAKNLPADSGYLHMGREYIPINPTGEFKSEQEFGNLLISSSSGANQVYLRDVAEIRRGYREPAKTLMRFDGVPSIGFAVSAAAGVNVVSMGEAIAKRARELQSVSPLGMEAHIVSLQSTAVVKAINDFLISLAQAVAIVVVVLLAFMGLRSGLIIGAVLLVTILGTFIFMSAFDITLQRISLGALVIALGLLVDNAIVVTDGIRVKLNQGQDVLSAAKEIVGQTAVPLLGATIVAITAFASIGTSDDSTGEYTATLFYVILISLLLSWVTAVSTTPLLCKAFLKPAKKAGGKDNANKDPYGGALYRVYRGFLSQCIRFRWVTLAVVIVMFVSSIVGFGSVRQSFFPNSTRPQFYVDFWFPEGTDIEETSQQMVRAEKAFLEREGVTHVTTQIGGGSPRFLLTYSPESNYGSFAQTLVDVDDYRVIPAIVDDVQDEMEALFPQAIVQVRQFVLGPSTGGKIQLRINGPDPAELRRLAAKAEAIMLDDPYTQYVRNEWRSKIKVVRPQMSEAQANRAGITRPDIAAAIATAVEGTKVGIYRERDELLPIISRAPASERVDLDNLGAIPVWSPVANGMIPLDQVVSSFKTEFEDANLWRRNRTSMLKIHSDPRGGLLPSELLARIKPKIERALNVDVGQVSGKQFGSDEDAFANFNDKTLRVGDADIWPLKGMPGYYMSWGGDAEGSARAGNSLGATVPIFFGLMVLIVLMLFNSIRKTLVIWLTVPLSIIGVTAGLLLFNQPFGFMALLGLMSLSGMLIKNAVVLLDEINAQLDAGKAAYHAVVDSGVSRLIPVSMAASTTILGLIPLLGDAFFVAMAVTIMFGLGFATVLTLIVVPVLYAVFFKVPHEQAG
ncbi:MAG: efflux RND transporter permease subunit, partial [Gammaproteobacteria bacterium]|nr:efflux RND transporter permease subunit [Gammaproteobacteria bacterium]